MGSGESAAFLAAAPEPTAGKREDHLQAPARRSSTAPLNPENRFPARCSIRISVFPGPQTKKAQQGLRTASGGVVFDGFRVTGNLINSKSPSP